MTLSIRGLRGRLAEHCETVSHVTIAGRDGGGAFHVERDGRGVVRFGGNPEQQQTFEQLMRHAERDRMIVLSRAMRGHDADGTVREEVRGWTCERGLARPLPRNHLFWAENTDPRTGEPLAPEPGVTVASDTNEEPILDFSDFQGVGEPVSVDRTPNAEGTCPFHVRLMPSMPADAGPEAREAFRAAEQARAAITGQAGVERCLDAAIAHWMLRMPLAGKPAWGDDPQADRDLCGRHRHELAQDENGLIENVSEEALDRMLAGEARSARALFSGRDGWAGAPIRRSLRTPPDGLTAEQLGRCPHVSLPVDRCFLDFEDSAGHPTIVTIANIKIGVHGAFATRFDGGIMLRPVLSVDPDPDVPENIRLPHPAIAYCASTHARERIGADCEVLVDCATGEIYEPLADELLDLTAYRFTLTAAKEAADRIMVSLLTPRHPPGGRRPLTRHRRR